jgi:hypothetical protein
VHERSTAESEQDAVANARCQRIAPGGKFSDGNFDLRRLRTKAGSGDQEGGGRNANAMHGGEG